MSTPLLQLDWQRLPNAPQPGTTLCALHEIAAGVAREFAFPVVIAGEPDFRLIVYRKEDSLHGYVNQCPHHWLPLNRPNQPFLRWSEAEIMCVHHSAVFDLARDGKCSMGPCQGSNLVPVPLQVEDGVLRIAG